MSFTVVVGNPRPASRTASVAVAAARAVVRAAGLPDAVDVVDLSALGPAVLESPTPREVTDALDRVRASDLLLVASPVYKGAYTGLLKAFLDLLPHRALVGTTALPLLVVGAPEHALAVEVHLRPLLVELGATVPTPGLALPEERLVAPDAVLAQWAEQVVPAVRGAPTAGTVR
ncbi:UNVERIFIED_ORG: FMN reductase [Actinomadura viridilutea]